MNLKIGNKTSNNYGEFLYERDKKYQEEKEKKIVLIKQKKYQEEKKYYTFKPIINNNKTHSNSITKDISYDDKRMNNNIYNYNNDLKKYLNSNHSYKAENLKHKENFIKNNIDKNQASSQKLQDNKNKNKLYNNNLFYNSNKQIKTKSKIPYDKNRNNNINNYFQKLYDSRVKTPLEKNHLSSSKSFSNKSLNNFNTNSNSLMFSEEENRNIFINLFNSLSGGEKEFISGKTLTMNKVPKNILVIINPIIKELLNNKNIQMSKEDFISCMNAIFNNISSVDKRLIIYTYNNRRHNKNKSLVLSNNNKKNFSQLKIKPETPDFSLKNKYNYYYNSILQKKPMNNLKNNVGFQSSKAQKKVEEFLYGDNSNFYHGF